MLLVCKIIVEAVFDLRGGVCVCDVTVTLPELHW
jgi:hypothetical protein